MGKKKIVKQAESAKSSKMPKVVENPEGYLKSILSGLFNVVMLIMKNGQ
ncbi:hypothetical protein LC724_33510 [Blautia sp. RD014234]|nr:hypothetical protein [Blautia parvula]